MSKALSTSTEGEIQVDSCIYLSSDIHPKSVMFPNARKGTCEPSHRGKSQLAKAATRREVSDMATVSKLQDHSRYRLYPYLYSKLLLHNQHSREKGKAMRTNLLLVHVECPGQHLLRGLYLLTVPLAWHSLSCMSYNSELHGPQAMHSAK